MRRTTTHDSTRPDGVRGPVNVVALGRDLYTGYDGSVRETGSARLDIAVGYPERVITRIGAEPSHPGLQTLVGLAASSGFRQAVDDAMPGERVSRSLRFQLLDDLPTASLVSGYAVQAAGVRIARRGPMLQRPDLCAGWVAGGTLVSALDGGRPPAHVGPSAPPLDSIDDPIAWHEMSPLPAHGMRRRRRLDVWHEEELAMVECFFRDSHMDTAGVETIVHEYTVHATVDPQALRFTSCDAEIGALPWPECPNAVGSAARLGGAPVVGLRRFVRETFVGPSTCTHLNDTLRSLEDVGALLAQLQAA